MSTDDGWATVGAAVDADWLAALFPSKGEQKRAQWLIALHENEFESQDDLAALDAAGWESLPLPLAIKAAVRQSFSTAAPAVGAPAAVPTAATEEGAPPPAGAATSVTTVVVAPPVAAPPPAITQCDIIVIDISASMRAFSSLDPHEGHADPVTTHAPTTTT